MEWKKPKRFNVTIISWISNFKWNENKYRYVYGINSSYLLDLWKKEQRLNRIEQIINAIEYAHNDNKLHRDLSPQNILIFDNNGEIEVKVSDFWLGKDVESLFNLKRF